MGKVYQSIDRDLATWITKQKMFFVATAPLSDQGHINCSPRGGDSFRVLSGTEVAWQDYTGSGVETIAHLRENGRIVIMFCAFDGPPKIVRLYGRGTVITGEQPAYGDLVRHFPEHPGSRAIIHVDLSRIADSCGFSVPLYDFRGQRDILDRWSAEKEPEELRAYRRTNNRESIDGLPGLESERG